MQNIISNRIFLSILLVITLSACKQSEKSESLSEAFIDVSPSDSILKEESSFGNESLIGSYKINSDKYLDISLDNRFVTIFSIDFLLDSVPKNNERFNVVSKYNARRAPYPGWAIGIRSYGSSIRPGFYLRNNQARGGWHLFSEINIKEKKWYNLSFAIKNNEYIVSFFNILSQENSNEVEYENINKNLAIINFLGGVPIEDIESPSTNSDLLFGGEAQTGNTFSGKVGRIVIAKVDKEFKSFSDYNELFLGGAKSLIEKLSYDTIVLDIDIQQNDKSKHQRTVIRSGQ